MGGLHKTIVPCLHDDCVVQCTETIQVAGGADDIM